VVVMMMMVVVAAVNSVRDNTSAFDREKNAPN
jgi:hypothetical protein